MSIWDKLLKAFLLMRQPWLISLALIAVMTILLSLFCRKFSWRSARMSIYGLLVSLPDQDVWRLAVSLSRFFFVVGVAFSTVELAIPHYLMLFLLCLPFDLIRLQPLRLLFALLNGAMLAAALFTGDMLLTYIREVRPESGILAIYALLTLFVVLYAAYLSMRDIQQLASERLSIGKGGGAHAQREEA